MGLLNKQTYRLKATTIMESLVAMTVTAIAFGVALMVVETVLNSQKAAFKYRVQKRVQTLIEETKKQRQYLDQLYSEVDYIIEKKVEVHEAFSDIYRLEFIAKNLEGKELFTHRELIYLP